MDMDMQYGHAVWTWTCSMDMDGHGHAARTWTRSTDLVMQHGSGQWTCMDARMPIKSSVWHRQFSLSLQRLVRHWYSGIMVSLVLLASDQYVSAQLCHLLTYFTFKYSSFISFLLYLSYSFILCIFAYGSYISFPILDDKIVQVWFATWSNNSQNVFSDSFPGIASPGPFPRCRVFEENFSMAVCRRDGEDG